MRSSEENSCKLCPISTYADELGLEVCKNHTVTSCDKGFELTAGTASSNGSCSACSAGEYQPDDASTDACTPYTVTSCDKGLELTAGTTSSNGSCSACSAGEYQPDNSSAEACTAYTVISCS